MESFVISLRNVFHENKQTNKTGGVVVVYDPRETK